MQVIILAGGYGSRLSEQTDQIPKPLVEIGGRPIILHIMDVYIKQGFKDFIIATGYKSELIKRYFRDLLYITEDVQLDFHQRKIEYLTQSSFKQKKVSVKIIDTGLNTQTGSRLKRLAPYLEQTFMLTYGDGVGNINLSKLNNLHQKNNSVITITSVEPTSRYGSLKFQDNRVTGFLEKPKFSNELINIGFMIIEKQFLDYIDNDLDIYIEAQPFERAIKDKCMFVNIHNGFWHPMDTLRDQRKLNELALKQVPDWLDF